MCARDAGADRRARIMCYEYTIACYYYYYYYYEIVFIYYIQWVAGRLQGFQKSNEQALCCYLFWPADSNRMF